MEGLKKENLQCIPFRDDDNSFDRTTIEQRISNSVTTAVILTDQCLAMKEIVFALQSAAWCYHPRTSRVILVSHVNHRIYLFQVHAAESCSFPVPPHSVSGCFEDKAITWLTCKS